MITYTEYRDILHENALLKHQLVIIQKLLLANASRVDLGDLIDIYLKSYDVPKDEAELRPVRNQDEKLAAVQEVKARIITILERGRLSAGLLFKLSHAVNYDDYRRAIDYLLATKTICRIGKARETTYELTAQNTKRNLKAG